MLNPDLSWYELGSWKFEISSEYREERNIGTKQIATNMHDIIRDSVLRLTLLI